MKRRHELTDSQWEQIAPYLPGKKGDPGRTGENNRRFVNAVIWLAKTGAPWRDLPERLGKWNSVFQRYNRWCKKGVWQRIFETLNLEPDLEHLLLNSTTGRERQHAAAGKGGVRSSELREDRAVAGEPRFTLP